jgi:tetratricopeptide (TPR) repeat protein
MFRKFFKKDEEMPLPLRAIQALQEKQYQKSLELFNEYITSIEKSGATLDADDAIFYYNRSIAKTQLNDMSGAIDDLSESISINPSFYQGIAERGRLLLAEDRFKEAEKDFSHCLAMNPENSAHYFCQRGYANFNSGNGEQAISDFINAYQKGNKEAEQILRERTNYFNQ